MPTTLIKLWTYNSIGQVVKNTDEDGFKTELKYNEAGLLTSMKCSDGNHGKTMSMTATDF